MKGVDQELRLLSRILDDLARGSPCQELDQTALHHQPEQSGKTKQGSFDTQEDRHPLRKVALSISHVATYSFLYTV